MGDIGPVKRIVEYPDLEPVTVPPTEPEQEPAPAWDPLPAEPETVPA